MTIAQSVVKDDKQENRDWEIDSVVWSLDTYKVLSRKSGYENSLSSFVQFGPRKPHSLISVIKLAFTLNYAT